MTTSPGDIPPIKKFGVELRLLMLRWLDEGNLTTAEIAGMMAQEQHAMLTAQFLARERKNPPAG